MRANRSPTVTVMARAASKAARGLLHDFGEVEQLQVSRKGPADFVSIADTKAEAVLREELARARPEYGFLMEESGEVAGSDPRHRWIVDPLDGTVNFLHGLPHWSISIALERDGEMVSGIVYDPLRDELFWAEKGSGAYLADPRQQDRRLRVSAREKLADAIFATGIPGRLKDSRPEFFMLLQATMEATTGFRRWGSAALDLAYVAAGRFDAMWEIGLKPWDSAAGIVLVREAGGFVSEMDGSQRMIETGNLLAANAKLHAPMLAVLENARQAKNP
jgi:myo-inositol-1(or 4)-monophosphatase